MADFDNTISPANGREFDRKDRPTSDSDSGNVVDHFAPHGEHLFPEGRGEECRSRKCILTTVCA